MIGICQGKNGGRHFRVATSRVRPRVRIGLSIHDDYLAESRHLAPFEKRGQTSICRLGRSQVSSRAPSRKIQLRPKN